MSSDLYMVRRERVGVRLGQSALRPGTTRLRVGSRPRSEPGVAQRGQPAPVLTDGERTRGSAQGALPLHARVYCSG